MWFFTYLLCFLSLLTLCEARTFTSSDGIRKIEASVTAYDKNSDVVSILRNDGRTFNCKLSSFSNDDQEYILNWLKGANENYLYVGKEYPGHLQMFIKILNAGGIGYGQTILFQPGLPPVVIGNGTSPFLAWVNGYDKLQNVYDQFSVSRINFDLIENNWRASISYQAGRSIKQNSGFAFIPSSNFYGLPSVAGPILYQQPQKIVILGKNQSSNSVVVLPRGPAPVFINPYSGGMTINRNSVANPSYQISSRTRSQGASFSFQISK